MSTLTLPSPPGSGASPHQALKGVMIAGDGVHVPGWVTDFPSFRRWTLSDNFTDRGRIDYLDGEIWVDMTMEEFYWHNQVKAEIGQVLASIVEAGDMGHFIPNRMRLVHPGVGLSCEPDWAFASWDTMASGRLVCEKTARGKNLELIGTPDVVLEVVSTSSETKDDRDLRRLYWEAGIREYWLVDVRQDPLRFNVFHHSPAGYAEDITADGWSRSAVFAREFQLIRGTDRLGKPQFRLEVR